MKNMLNLNRRTFLKSTALATASLSLNHCSKSKQRPNILLIVLDDLGWDDLGCHGNTIVSTPTINKLASESVRFKQFYVNPVCAPTRASLLTGRHFLRTGVSHVHGGKDFIHLDENIIAEHFRQAGYATGMWGKWHSGHTDGYYPWERGFDEAYMAQLYKHENSFGVLNGEPVEHSGWADQVITDYAIDFMRRHQHKPFFAFLPYLTCHTPLQAPEPFITKYQQKGLSKNLATLYGMIDHLDGHLARLFTSLDDLGLSDNTIVFFLSDNGPAVSNGLLTDEDREVRYVNQLKGHKGNIWENGVKSPLFVRWQGHYKPRFVEELADVTDLFPTLLDVCGIPLPADGSPIDGRSVRPLLEGREHETEKKVSFNYANPGWPPTDKPWTPEGVMDEYRPIPPDGKASIKYNDQIISVRKGKYKLLFNPGQVKDQAELIDGYALFHILSDPREEKNLVDEKTDVFENLQSELQSWFDGIINEPHAFAMPTFLIGENGRLNNTVLAKGPTRISAGLKNTFNQLWDWHQGDWAEYAIDVRTAGRYDVILQHDSDEASNARVRISIGEHRLSTVVQDNQRVECGEIELSPGPHTLRLDILQSSGLAIDKLIAIHVNVK